MRYQDGNFIAEAVQFQPDKSIYLGIEIKPWPDERGVQPKDMSWGYMERTGGSRIHIHLGDWILKESENNIFVSRDDAFQAKFKPVEPVLSEERVRQIVRD